MEEILHHLGSAKYFNSGGIVYAGRCKTTVYARDGTSSKSCYIMPESMRCFALRKAQKEVKQMQDELRQASRDFALAKWEAQR